MRALTRMLRAGGVALVVAAAPGCAALAPLARPEAAAPRAQSLELRAYGVLALYAETLAAAAEIAAAPDAPRGLINALAQAERAATPAAEALAAALRAHVSANADAQARAALDQALERAGPAVTTFAKTLEAR
jgi:hypothetical protein